MATSPAITTFDGSIIPGVISGLTVHDWTADSKGQFHTGDLKAEWVADYATMLAGRGDTLTALQRMEGNAEAVIENTAASKLTAEKQQAFREDGQREFDAIYSAMQSNQTTYGIDPTAQFSVYSYLKMEETLQANEQLKELGYQGHGVNSPPATRYNGFTTEFQNNTDTKTFYVGGGPGNGENAIANFYDDDVLTHAPFPTVMNNGVLTQLNQNGNLEDPLASDALVAANATAFTRVFVASDFSLDKTAVGEVRLVPNVKPAAAPPTAAAGSIVTFDGSVIAGTIAGLTAHTWTADTKGLFHTTDLKAEWVANYSTMLAGHGDTLTALQRMEGNAEAVIENTAAAKFTAAQQQMFREDAQREYDAIDAAMRMNQTTLGIDPKRQFNVYTYLQMEETLQGNEQLKELGYQGHGVNSPPAPRYSGFTGDFQNKTDGKTFYVGGGPGSGENAIANFFDDDVLTHAPFAAVLHNGVLTQLNQNGNLEGQLTSDALVAANAAAYTRVYVASDFSLDAKAIGEVRLVPNALDAPPPPAVPAPIAVPPPVMLGYVDQTSGASGAIAMEAAAAGGPGYLQNQYIYTGNDNMAFATSATSVFIHSGGGNDAIQVASGQNVLDGGLGSNFLTGGTGTDTFFTDARAPGAVWNTIRNFHGGDAATLWGFAQGVSSYRWETSIMGAAGSEGATLRANIVGGAGRVGNGIDASITFAGLSVAQAKNLQLVTGTQSAGSYLYIYNPGV